MTNAAAFLAGPPDPRPAISYRWSWPHLFDAHEFIVSRPRVEAAIYAAVLGVFAVPHVRDATGVSFTAIAVVCAIIALWLFGSRSVLGPRVATSKAAFDAMVIGNVLLGTTAATAIPLLGDAPGSVLWCALVIYATANGAIIGFAPSIVLQLFHVGVPLASIPIFVLRGHDGWAIAGPMLAATFAGVGYHLSAFHAATGFALRRAVEARLARTERLATELQLARDLHDAVGSTLGTVKVYADLLSGSSPAIATPLSDVAQAGLDDLRAVLDALAPPRAEGLEATIAAIARRIAPSGVAVRLRGEWPAETPAQLRVAAARIVQEAAHNAIRHAGPTTIVIASALDDDAVKLSVRDDGRGFELRDDAGGGRGLASMRARAAELGGSLAIETRPGDGCTVVATLPRVGHARPAA